MLLIDCLCKEAMSQLSRVCGGRCRASAGHERGRCESQGRKRSAPASECTNRKQATVAKLAKSTANLSEARTDAKQVRNGLHRYTRQPPRIGGIRPATVLP